ncbi:MULTISPECIES: lytic murein transglycosylase [unclassified Mycobacterium]|uniref:lytic transglycosylase domain-containing protein n=1 Tax=unclassified Mycobacterium TaxID=2642494 RepID=UPI00089C729B|nr:MULTISPECIES: lytic murein transglycosylase [unclassified Mycobacterium]SEA97330.1 Membrane-bound lytic murein transglycosylase B [Mycobacterium sp. 283mftsu]
MHIGGDTADSADNAAPTTEFDALPGEGQPVDDAIEDYDAAVGDDIDAATEAGPGRRRQIAKALRRPLAGVAVVAPLVLMLAVGGSSPTRQTTVHNTATAGVTPLAAVTPTTPGPRNRAGMTVVASDQVPRALHMDPTTALSPPPASLVMAPGGLRIPPVVLNAYRTAEKIMATNAPGCGISWNLLAGIGRIESGHANSGATDARGTALTPILGPVLDGTLAGNEVIVQSISAGRVTYARALGPMQFLPGTWARYASDAIGDGKPDVQNVYDASLAAARYLCSGGLNLRDPSQVLTAILRYNNSMPYAQNVLGWAKAYVTGIAPVDLPPIVGPPPAIGDQHLDNPEGLGPGLPINAMGLPSDDPLAMTPALQMGRMGPLPGPAEPKQNCAVFCLQGGPAPSAVPIPAPDAPALDAPAPNPFGLPPFQLPPAPLAPAPVAPAPAGPGPIPVTAVGVGTPAAGPVGAAPGPAPGPAAPAPAGPLPAEAMGPPPPAFPVLP